MNRFEYLLEYIVCLYSLKSLGGMHYLRKNEVLMYLLNILEIPYVHRSAKGRSIKFREESVFAIQWSRGTSLSTSLFAEKDEVQDYVAERVYQLVDGDKFVVRRLEDFNTMNKLMGRINCVVVPINSSCKKFKIESKMKLKSL